MKKNVKILSTIIIALTLLSVIGSVAFAFTPDQVTEVSLESSNITKIGGKIFAAVRIVGTIASVVILAVLGVKYITASPEGKADYKANMIPYLVGAVLLFGASNLVSIVYGWINNATN